MGQVLAAGCPHVVEELIIEKFWSEFPFNRAAKGQLSSAYAVLTMKNWGGKSKKGDDCSDQTYRMAVSDI